MNIIEIDVGDPIPAFYNGDGIKWNGEVFLRKDQGKTWCLFRSQRILKMPRSKYKAMVKGINLRSRENQKRKAEIRRMRSYWKAFSKHNQRVYIDPMDVRMHRPSEFTLRFVRRSDVQNGILIV